MLQKEPKMYICKKKGSSRNARVLGKSASKEGTKRKFSLLRVMRSERRAYESKDEEESYCPKLEIFFPSHMHEFEHIEQRTSQIIDKS
jgi:hypothetical protein